jgi:hypothetical protein
MKSDEYNTISILINTKCHPWLHELACGFTNPSCSGPDRLQILYPCKNLCESVQSTCAPVLLQLGYNWPSFLACDFMPENKCIGENLSNGMCPNGTIACSEDDFTCLPEEWKCDGFQHCTDGADEMFCEKCDFECSNGLCLPESSRCNGELECPDGEDESFCPECKTDQFMCGDRKCIPSGSWCDGLTDCSDLSDEIDCYGEIDDVVVVKKPKSLNYRAPYKQISSAGNLTFETEWVSLCSDYFESTSPEKAQVLERTCDRLKMNPTKIQDPYRTSKMCKAPLLTSSCPTCGVHKSRVRRVLYGKIPEKFAPWVSAIEINGMHHCGGTLVTGHIVLSAAHCFFNYQSGNYEDWRIKMGQRSARKFSATRRIKVIILLF